MLKRVWIAILLCLFLSVPVLAADAAEKSEKGPMETIQAAVDKVLEILNDPAYADPSMADAQLEKMTEEIRSVFDFETMARGTLRHQNWDSFTDDQKKEFTDLFTKLLGDIYLARIQENYNHEKMSYLEQEMLSDKKAMVKTKIIRESTEIPIDYRLIRRDGNWKVYNVYVENTSLVSNYRDQFNRVLLSGSPADLIKMLREKVENKETGKGES